MKFSVEVQGVTSDQQMTNEKIKDILNNHLQDAVDVDYSDYYVDSYPMSEYEEESNMRTRMNRGHTDQMKFAVSINGVNGVDSDTLSMAIQNIVYNQLDGELEVGDYDDIGNAQVDYRNFGVEVKPMGMVNEEGREPKSYNHRSLESDPAYIIYCDKGIGPQDRESFHSAYAGHYDSPEEFARSTYNMVKGNFTPEERRMYSNWENFYEDLMDTYVEYDGYYFQKC